MRFEERKCRGRRRAGRGGGDPLEDGLKTRSGQCRRHLLISPLLYGFVGKKIKGLERVGWYRLWVNWILLIMPDPESS